MKKILFFFSLILAVCLTSCELDNYEAPNINLVGKVVYQGKQIYVRNNQVTFRLYEPGWELSSSTYMDVQVKWDGTFSAGVYGGKTYKLIRQPNIGPWVNPTANDTITVNNYDGREVVMEVTPYYLLDNAKLECNGRLVTGSCHITEVTPGMSIEKVGLYVNRNIIVDDVYTMGAGSYVETTENLAGGQTVSLNVDLSGFSINSTANSLPQTGKVYARMGLKINGIEAMVFTEPVALNFTK